MDVDTLANALIVRHGGTVGKMKLQKLMYYAHAWHLAITGEALVDSAFQAWRDGPVLPQVWISHGPDAARTSRAVDDPDLDPFSSRLLDMVIDQYGKKYGGELSTLTHAELPWRDARGELPPDASSRAPLSNQLMSQYYRDEQELCGYSAAELAVLGLPPAADDVEVFDELSRPVDVDGLPEDEWGGANLFVIPGFRDR